MDLRKPTTWMRLFVPVTVTLLGICLVAVIGLGVLSLLPEEAPPQDNGELTPPDTPSDPEPVDRPTVAGPVLLGPTADAGQSYIDSMIFVGESTTAHLRSREVLTGGKDTTQVWSTTVNTMKLDLNITQKTIVYPKTGQEMTIAAAAALERPRLMVLSFGVNDILRFATNESLYRTAYGMLIDAIRAASPQTVVLLQTVYPLAANQTTFGEGTAVINGYIDRLNEILPEIATQHGAYVVDTASVLRDANGALRQDYQTGDGIHLTTPAYVAILNYMRTHAYLPGGGEEE